MLTAAAAVASEQGYEALSATAVVARAGVSRKTFYDLFERSEDCFLTVIEQALAEMAALGVPAYARESRWSARVRTAVAALLAFLEHEQTGVLALSYLVGYGPNSPELRARVLGRLRALVDEGRAQADARAGLSPLTAELVVGAALSVVHRRLRGRQPQLVDLLGPLMWMIVLPYLGPAAAGRELLRKAPAPAPVRPAPSSDPLRGLNMRLTYRTARVLEVIAVAPGANNVEIGELAGIKDQGQISKLLSRLADLELIERTDLRSPANSWSLTSTGHDLESAIRRDPARARQPRAGRRHV